MVVFSSSQREKFDNFGTLKARFSYSVVCVEKTEIRALLVQKTILVAVTSK